MRLFTRAEKKSVIAVTFFIFVFSKRTESAPLTVEPSFLLVEEDWPVGTHLPVVICPRNVKIFSGDQFNFFNVVKINETCATLQLMDSLDADKETADGVKGQSFSLVLSGPKKSRATLEIQIVDVNDNAPQFANIPSSLEISEKAAVGTEVVKITTTDPDTGISGISRFSVDGDEFFSVEKRECRNGKCSTTLKVAKPLDFDSKPTHVFNITAKDGDPHSNKTHSVSQQMTIHLKKEKHEVPVFLTDFTQIFSINESAKPEDVVAKVSALDIEKSGVSFSMSENSYFSIDATSGNVILKRMPEHDEVISVEITASTVGKNDRNFKSVMRLKPNRKSVVPASESKTEVEKEQYLTERQLCEFPMYEAHLVQGTGRFEKEVLINTLAPATNEIRLIGGSEIFDLIVRDSHQLELKVVDAEKVSSQNLDNAHLLVKSNAGQCRIVLRSIPQSSKNAPIPTKAKMTPKFDLDVYEFNVLENREPSVLGAIKVLSSGPVTFELLGEAANQFEVSQSGEIRNKEPLDREKNGKLQLTIKATDENGASAKSQLNINVQDENDNPPTFESDNIVVSIDEGKSEKIKINATDLDDGKNGQMSYTIEEKSDLPIDIADGVLFIGAIDRESMKSNEVNLTVIATDSGDPPRTGRTIVTIRVKDMNDNPPIFSNSRYSIVLDANISPGGVVGKVKSEDRDATSPNNYIHYSSQNSQFKISDDGEVIFIGPGTLQKDTYMEFNISATDGGNPSMSASAVIVLNEYKRKSTGVQNELTTQINSNDTMEKSEIKWLNAGMTGYSYEIIRAVADGFADEQVMKWVEIDKKSGRIMTLTRINPDNVKQIKLYISMRKGKREVPVELIINVVDTDETTPVYEHPSKTRQFNISESATVGTTVGAMPAVGTTIKDAVKYSLRITSGPKHKLQIDSNGNIRILRSLNFEEERQIRGIVQASLQPNKKASAPFLLTILDANDNRPVFKNSSVFATSLSEDSVLGTVLDLPYPLAVDSDSEKFASLRYSMTGDEGFFKIDERNSTIYLVAPLDYETQRIHSVSVRCVDNNGEEPHHEVFASITINVRDVNDNIPVIHNKDLTHLNIGEDAVSGTVVTVLIVSDADREGKDSLNVDVNSTMFRVDDALKLVVASSLKGYAGQRLCSTVTVRDSGAHVVTTPYCVTVYPAKNTHHNPLVISPKPNSIHYFDENISYDELLVVTVLAEDEAERDNIEFRLDEMFKKDWQAFVIGEKNGSLRARQPFDFEKKTVHEIKILACRVDNCTSTHLFISVNDRNDNCPMFPKQDVRLAVIENEKGLRQVGRIPAALDADFHSDNTKVCYSTDTPMFFFSDLTLPILYTNSSFDREHKKQHQITITAYDCHLSCRDPHKPINGTIVALIDVIDVNDNFPKFSERVYSTTIVQGQVTAGSHILTVVATDADEELEGLKYSIRGFIRSQSQTFTPSEAPISIHKTTGEVTANELLKGSSYSFTVVVIDGANHEDTASVVISVVTYAQQTELVFDAPFELVIKNEKNIADNLSNCTGLKTVVDKCRQNSNFTLMLVHFMDRDGQFVNVDKAVNLLMTSSAESRRELRSVYGLREAFPPVPIPSKLPQYISIAVLLFITVFILSLCTWCRQRNNYERKLRHISAQASTVHTVTLGRNMKKGNPAYGEIPIVTRHHPPPAPPPPSATVNLQSTEL